MSAARRHAARALALVAALALAPGCAALGTIIAPPRYDAKSLPSGVELQDLVVPEGGRVAGGSDEVTIDLVAWTGGGRRFESTYAVGRPLTFELGSGVVPHGLDEGVRGMRVGGRRSIVVPPELAFGDAGIPGEIPPRSFILFDVSLVSVRRPSDPPIEPQDLGEDDLPKDEAQEPADAPPEAIEAGAADDDG